MVPAEDETRDEGSRGEAQQAPRHPAPAGDILQVSQLSPRTSSLSICRQHFLKFANLYLKVGYVLGGFQELNSINFEIVKEEMFGDEENDKTTTDEHENDVYEDEEIELSDDEEIVEDHIKKPNLLARFSKWFLSIFDINRYKNNWKWIVLNSKTEILRVS